MGRASSRKKQPLAGDATSKAKGSIAEQIVATMHNVSGVEVAANVFLPVIGGGRRREIDVLITAIVVGYQARYAIECKNERGAIGAPKIDAFIGKLKDVGIPPQYGIYVSVNGYTSGAVRRAKKEGIKTMILSGLTPDRLKSAIFKALQSVVHYLLQIEQFTVTYKDMVQPKPQEMPILCDKDGNIRLTIQDIVWKRWLDGEPPTVLGEYVMEIPIPDGLYQKVGGELVELTSIATRVRVIGLVFSLGGVATQHVLTDAEASTAEKLQIQVRFEPLPGKLPISAVVAEEDLVALLRDSESLVHITARLRLPRIRFNAVYWPPSERIVQALGKRVQAFQAGEAPEPQVADFAELEGTDLSAVWDPIWHGHPASGLAS